MDHATKHLNDLERLEAKLGGTIPAKLRNQYQCATDLISAQEPFRLMPPDEVNGTLEAMRDFGLNMRQSCAFWSDDNSNYAALYLAGPLVGKVCFLNHDEIDFAPVYR